jgi:hypothetical protein
LLLVVRYLNVLQPLVYPIILVDEIHYETTTLSVTLRQFVPS